MELAIVAPAARAAGVRPDAAPLGLGRRRLPPRGALHGHPMTRSRAANTRDHQYRAFTRGASTRGRVRCGIQGPCADTAHPPPDRRHEIRHGTKRANGVTGMQIEADCQAETERRLTGRLAHHTRRTRSPRAGARFPWLRVGARACRAPRSVLPRRAPSVSCPNSPRSSPSHPRTGRTSLPLCEQPQMNT